MNVRGQRSQIVHRILVRQVARTQNVLDAAGHEQTLESLGQTVRSVRYVKIADD